MYPFLTVLICLLNVYIAFAQSLPRAGIREIYVDGLKRTIDNKGTLTLQPDEDDLQIYFEVPPSVDSFVYQLGGLDKTTIKTVIPFTRYTNLKGNDYVFTLFYQKNTSSSEPSKLNIRVLPKTTESAWFIPAIVLYVTLLVGAITYFWLMYNFRQKMRMQKIRNKIAEDLHDEVGSTLSSISIFSKSLKRDLAKREPTSVPILDEIIQSADQTNHNLHDSVWSINPQYDDMEVLIEKIRSFAFQTLSAQDIQLIFEADMAEISKMSISMLQRRNVYLMMREAINNIIKHAEASQVTIRVKKDNRKVRLTIADNGKGFDQGGGSDRNGLKNFQSRAKESFIKFNIESKLNEGTTITMLIPQL